MRSKQVTLNDIAKSLSISKNAVSLALRGKAGVSDELRQKIVQKAKELNYMIEDKSQSCLLALIPQNVVLYSGTFYQQLCFFMESYARSKGFLLTICSVSEQDEQTPTIHPMLNQMPFQGVVTIGNLSRDYCRQYRDYGVKYVMADQYYHDIDVTSVTTTNASGAYSLTTYLIDHGHKKIQYFGSSKRTSSLNDRWNGYKQAMKDHHLPVLHNTYIDAQFDDTSIELELVRQAIESLPELPTAYVCGHDGTAKCIIEVLAQKGLHYPQDYSIVGFDDIQSPEVVSLNLTTYRTNKSAIAMSCVDMLTDKKDLPPQKVEIYGEIIYRSSVRDIR